MNNADEHGGTMNEQPLTGIKVVDLGRWIAAPYCAVLLADLGADVLKIESPAGDPSRREGPFAPSGESLYFAQMNRNKRGLTLDLRSAEGRRELHDQVRDADFLIENFRPGVLEKLGLGPEDLPSINPRCITVRVSGFGQDSPIRDRAAFDCILQSKTGIASMSGADGDFPVLVGSYVVDVATAMSTATACLAALHQRERDGSIVPVESTLLDSALALLGPWVAAVATTGEDPVPAGNADRTSAPANAYEAQDGWVYIHAGPTNFWRWTLEKIGREDALEDPRFLTEDSRIEHRVAADQIIADWTRERSTAEVEEAMGEVGVPATRVNKITEALEDADLQIGSRLREVRGASGEALQTLLSPFRLPGTGDAIRGGVPQLDEPR
jgi:crotonobetainyl-CoA:carnitine CoA-transferase CaiB-like acyl-CoA transferase